MAAMALNTGGLPQGELLGRYRNYEDAQKVVDYLAKDQNFDVRALTIVGNELRSVEKIRGRLSYPRAAGTGALQGAIFGTFMGLLLMLFSPQAPLTSLGMAVLMGMAIWMIIAVISFAARRGSRGFVSASQLVATTFDVVCDFQVAGKARQLVKESGVASLNAWNDPTGKSSALTGGALPKPPQQTAPEPTTTPQPSPDTADQPAEAAQQENHFEVEGRPRYGVRLADVEQASEAEQAAEGASGAEQAAEGASGAEQTEPEQPAAEEKAPRDAERHAANEK